MKKLLLFSLSLWGIITLQAEVTLPQLFQDHMVIQHHTNVPVWGWADPNESITVVIETQEHQTTANQDGKWEILLDPVDTGGPYQMTITGQNTISIRDIYAGEVWICSGQSNMEWIVRNSNNADTEITQADYPLIRHFKVPHIVATLPAEKITEETGWEICNPETVGNFTAVGYFFARDLHETLDVPIGLINTSWGGTEVETWISADAISTKTPYFREELETLKKMNLDSFEEEQIRKLKELMGEELTVEVPMENGVPLWAGLDIDISSWKRMEDLPSLWEERGLNGVDGVLWFRKHIELSQSQAGKRATLHLGTIDDQDITWINGVEVGATDSYNEPRTYDLDEGVLQTGKNAITIKITDTGGGGGLYGNSEKLYVDIGGEKISLAGAWMYKHESVTVNNTISPNQYVTLLYNAMVAPLIPYAFNGVIWYQGESNASRAHQYQTLFPLMIENWRDKWGSGDFPFLFVQLANFRQPVDTPEGSTWAELREAQTMALNLPNTGMASTIDIGEADDIHPRNKQDVGKRLALQAYRIAYDKDILSDGPMYQSHRIEDDKVIITFIHTGKGLTTRNKYGYVPGFTVAGEDQQFHWAKAEIIGANQIAVYSDRVAKPVAVRYGWADNPDDLSLYNSADLPMNPFRTDEWKGITE